ncbi:MAG: UDP-N-acetylmuramoyl-L-alanyl-D-glutamate--2,6-diaminopimelate ligase [Opitutaceae bacterium]|jgi:UDP-N-acetylmuramoyl-L-alanyl-D-glutamate--2,6-diaminopimelate ligase|nr:UDP-N-acetylmuramoyl-L-alanyl-D-glutamate--2,6-diaminopimelate ligase [Opitutaceae bacterium]
MIGYLATDRGLTRAFQLAAAFGDGTERKARRGRPALRRERAAAPGGGGGAETPLETAPRLSDFIRAGDALAVRGPLDRPISGIALDSRRVMPGALFFALPGLRSDGMLFVDEAVSRGAVAVVGRTLPARLPARATFIQAEDPRRLLARVAREYYGRPDEAMELVGVTGTNGKTTVAHLIRHLLGGAGRTGLLGTIHYDLGARTVPSFRTTPEAVDICGMLAQMREAGCRRAVMEVSSHGIAQRRVDGLRFATAVFTNLTRDHLDYHGTMEAYFGTKAGFFTGATGSAPAEAVVNIDDPHGRLLAERLRAECPGTRVTTYGESGDADFRAEAASPGFGGTAFRLVCPEGGFAVESGLVGRHNISNLLAALAAVWTRGMGMEAALARLASFGGVPGRMERVEAGQPFTVLVDYAHTDDALRNALGMLRAITDRRLLVVFGCGGNRDRTKRPLMMRAVQEHADFAIATADNPRNEPQARIFEDMRAGVTDPARVMWIEDRRRAMSLALDMCGPGDCLLVAGKGHETYQEFADTVTPFDDRQVVRELIGVKRGLGRAADEIL